jgi:hypothetical protein
MKTEEAVESLDALSDSVKKTEDALTKSAESAGAAEQAVRRKSRASREATTAADDQAAAERRLNQAYSETQQKISNLASGLSGLSTALGSESEVGSFLGRMAQLASTGVSLGSVFGPQGAVVGGIIGGAIPALHLFAQEIGLVERANDAAAESARKHAEEIDKLADSAKDATDILSSLQRSVSQQRARERLAAITGGDVSVLSPEDAALAAEDARRRIEARLESETGRRTAGDPNRPFQLGALNEQDLDRLNETFEEMVAADEALRSDIEPLVTRERLAGRRSTQGSGRGGRGAGSARARAESERQRRIQELMERAAPGGDALSFAAGLGGDDGRPSDFDIQLAGRRRPGGPGSGLEAARAELQAVEKLKGAQQLAHEAQMRRIEEQVAAWTTAGQTIGSSIYNAFQVAASGQEDYDVALVKSFKGLAIQFGGQMINEGIAALLTAIGNTALAPAVAAGKAAEGAGKLALGIGLGAAGAAIPVPASGGGQSNVPKLGPSQQDSGASGGSVIVNMNSPAIVTGTRAELGRELGATLRDARQRFGGRVSA